MASAKELHQAANQARESGNVQLALEKFLAARAQADAEHDVVRAAEIMADKSILSRRMATMTQDPQERQKWIDTAKSDINSAMMMGRQAEFQRHPQAMVMPLMQQAKYFAFVGDYTQAISSMRQAIEYMDAHPPADHDRPAFKTHVRLDLALLRLKIDENVESEIVELSTALQADTGADAAYNTAVWVSGAYLALAEHFIEGDPAKAKTYLSRAREIIFFDDRMPLRQLDYHRVENLLLSRDAKLM